MGKAFSALGRQAAKPIRTYNIEERAHKSIIKENRPKAPRHESTVKLIEESVRNLSEEDKRSLIEKDKDLLKRLETVYVTSQDVGPEKKESSESPTRPLPTLKEYYSEPEYGFHEPSKVMYGKITLRKALEAISRHHQEPEIWTAKRISMEYKLDTYLTEQMLKYFQTFVLIVPETEKKKLTQANMNITPIDAPIFVKQLASEGDSNKEPLKT